MDSIDYFSHASKQKCYYKIQNNRPVSEKQIQAVEACSDALYEMEGILRGVSVRTVQADIQMMRSDKLGYNAPIEVYDCKFYRYAEDNYSISESPLSDEMCEMLTLAVERLDKYDIEGLPEVGSLLIELKEKLQHMLALG